MLPVWFLPVNDHFKQYHISSDCTGNPANHWAWDRGPKESKIYAVINASNTRVKEPQVINGKPARKKSAEVHVFSGALFEKNEYQIPAYWSSLFVVDQ